VIGLFAFGALMLLFYTYPLKYFALGELAIFLIWGPIMVGGVYLVLTGHWNWNVALAAIPFGLCVASINVGKHIDKRLEDKAKGVTTLPVLIGETAARVLNITSSYWPTPSSCTLFSWRASSPRSCCWFSWPPKTPGKHCGGCRNRGQPKRPGYPVWPRWFSTVSFVHNRNFGNLFILALVADTLLRVFLPVFWH